MVTNDGNINNLISELKRIQADFYSTFNVTDIITNSKIFEILIADSLGHTLIPGHSGSRDAKDNSGSEFEYKHYKESSSNHTWTFNDFSNTTINKLNDTKAVIFAHIQDADRQFPEFDWYYEVPGSVISSYLAKATQKITNNRKMINVGPKKIEEQMGITKQIVKNSCSGSYSNWIKRIIAITDKIEKKVGVTGILTSNKFWEVLVALKLEHHVQSEQAKHDAIDKMGNKYEYKVARGSNWSFQDISKDVLHKYLSDKSVILAIVDKNSFEVKKIYEADAKKTVALLKERLREKNQRYSLAKKEVRRQQISISTKGLKDIHAKLVYPPTIN